MVVPARAQERSSQIPAVTLRPVGTDQGDPNGGRWFITNIAPNETKQMDVKVFNPAEIPQTVKLFLADMVFDATGTPEVTNNPVDVGTWGGFKNPVVTLQPRQSLQETFAIRAPAGVDPGDHIGAVVAEHQPQGSGNVLSVSRIAVRLYATLPGDARRQFVIDSVESQKDSAFFTRELDVAVQLKNTGRVRLEPKVTVDGVEAKGSAILMSYSAEPYRVTKKVPFWGGPVRMLVDAQTTSIGVPGPSQQLRVTIWVIPWHLLVLLAFAAGLVYLVRMALRRRGGKYEAMQADMRRIERLITQGAANGNGNGHGDDRTAAHAAIQAAIKQARRVGDADTADRLEQLLREQTAHERPAHAPLPPGV